MSAAMVTRLNAGIKRVWVFMLAGAVLGFFLYGWILNLAFDNFERALIEVEDAPREAAQRDAAVLEFAASMLGQRRQNEPQVDPVPTPETVSALGAYLPEDLSFPGTTLGNLGRYFRARSTGGGATLGTGPCSETNLLSSFSDAALYADPDPSVESCVAALIARYLSTAETVADLPFELEARANTPLTMAQFNRAALDFAIFGPPRRDEAVIIEALHRHFQITASVQVKSVLARALNIANEHESVERARLLVDLFRGIWQCLLMGILVSIVLVTTFVRLSSAVLPGARRRLAWLLDSATAFGLAGTVHGLILALFEIKSAMQNESSIAYAGVMGGMALAFSTTLIGVAIERFGAFFANGHQDLPG
jgi:hypothetical protein